MKNIKELIYWVQRSKYASLLQFVKFGLVGVSNTIISYGIEMLCYYVLFKNAEFNTQEALFKSIGITVSGEQIKVIIISILSFIISVTNSYYWNSRYVFKIGEKKTIGCHLKTYFKMMACYALTGLVLSPMIKMWLLGKGVAYWMACLAGLIISIPLNFILNKVWAFGKRKSNQQLL